MYCDAPGRLQPPAGLAQTVTAISDVVGDALAEGEVVAGGAVVADAAGADRAVGE